MHRELGDLEITPCSRERAGDQGRLGLTAWDTCLRMLCRNRDSALFRAIVLAALHCTQVINAAVAPQEERERRARLRQQQEDAPLSGFLETTHPR